MLDYSLLHVSETGSFICNYGIRRVEGCLDKLLAQGVVILSVVTGKHTGWPSWCKMLHQHWTSVWSVVYTVNGKDLLG